MIVGHGSSQPSIMFIGDSPFGGDITSNYALSGHTENVIKTCLNQNGLDIGMSYRTLLIKEDNFRIAEFYKQKKLIWSKLDGYVVPWLKQLEYEISSLDPFLLIPMGEISFHYLTGFFSIRKFRGSIMLTGSELSLPKQYKVLPILSPQILLKDYKMGFMTKAVDYAKIGKYLNDNPPPENLIRPWVATSAGELRNFLNRNYNTSQYMTFDWETYAGIPVCIALCFDGMEACCVPFMDRTIDIDHRMLMLDMVAKALQGPIPKGNQNVKFDWKIAERWGFEVNNVTDDPMLAASTLYCEFPKNLGFLTSIYTDIPYFKDEGKLPKQSKDIKKNTFYLYCAKDTIAAWQITDEQRKEVKHFGTEWVYKKLIEMTPHYKRMENNGIRIDDEQRGKLKDKYEFLLHREILKIRRLSSMDGLNPLSSTQCENLVYNVLGFKKIKGVVGTDEESLLLLIKSEKAVAVHSPMFGKDILQLIISCRKIHKVLEVLNLHIYPDGYFRCDYNLGGTKTGRTSAGKTIDEIILFGDYSKKLQRNKIETTELGHSLQTIGKHGFFLDGIQYGKDIRSMFVPSYGYRFVEIDLSQAEARVDAVLAKNYDILKVFDGPVGIHRLTGSWVYGCEPETIKKDTLEYHMAKTVRHAGERNMGADRMYSMTQINIKECARILKKFHEFQPEIRNVFHREVAQCVHSAERTIIAPNGRRHTFYDRINDKSVNDAISHIPQAVVSDQTKFYGIGLTADMQPWVRFCAEQHDGCLAEVPIGRENEYISVYTKNIEQPIDFNSGSMVRDFQLVIPAEASVGDNWAYLKGVKL